MCFIYYWIEFLTAAIENSKLGSTQTKIPAEKKNEKLNEVPCNTINHLFNISFDCAKRKTSAKLVSRRTLEKIKNLLSVSVLQWKKLSLRVMNCYRNIKGDTWNYFYQMNVNQFVFWLYLSYIGLQYLLLVPCNAHRNYSKAFLVIKIIVYILVTVSMRM